MTYNSLWPRLKRKFLISHKTRAVQLLCELTRHNVYFFYYFNLKSTTYYLFVSVLFIQVRIVEGQCSMDRDE